MDLNVLLEGHILANDAGAIEKLIILNINAEKTLTLVRITKNYALLEVLRPILDLNTIAKSAIMEDMYKDVLLDANKEGYLLLNKFCPLPSGDLSSLCGSMKCNPDLLGDDLHLYFYLRGVLEADDLDAFLLAREKYSGNWTGYSVFGIRREEDVRHILGRVFAPKIMEYIGYDEESLDLYLSGAVFHSNKPLLLHLASKEGTEKLFTSLVPALLIGTCLQEAVHCLLQGGIVFEEKFWSWLRQNKPDVYAACQADV